MSLVPLWNEVRVEIILFFIASVYIKDKRAVVIHTLVTMSVHLPKKKRENIFFFFECLIRNGRIELSTLRLCRPHYLVCIIDWARERGEEIRRADI
jgi:hypothetical protein